MDKLKLKFGTVRREERGSSPGTDLGGESDSSVGSMVSVAGSSDGRTHLKRVLSREAMSVAGSPIDSDDYDEVPATKVVAVPKRGRGRPPTTGEYVGLAKAKAALVAAQREEMELRAEREVAELTVSLRSQPATQPRLSESPVGEQEELASDLQRKVLESVATISSVAAKSSNLKGTFQRALKVAASTIKEAMADLQARSSTEETRRLQAANSRLRDEVAELRKEIVELRRDMTAAAASASAPPQASGSSTRREPRSTEEFEQAVLRQIGEMMNARFEALEGRLLPEKRNRPPLAADAKNAATRRAPTAPTSEPGHPGTSAASRKAEPLSNAQKSQKGKGKGKRSKGTPQPVAGPSSDTPRSVPTAQANETWAKVTKRGGKKTGGGTAPAPPQRQSQAQAGSQQSQGAASRRPAKTEKAAPKLIVPRSTAVIITLTPSAVERGASYAAALWEAKKKIDLAKIGIYSLDIRNTASGSRLLEVPGALSGDKADALAAKLSEVFDEQDVKISRPMKCADLRITGLDDSIKKEEVAAAIAAVGECDVGLVKANDIRRSAAGIGTTFVRCPVAAAKKVADKGRLLIGWVAAKVRVLAARPLRCFRCLEVGHVREKCPTDKTDRSGECYRCGQTGHKAKECSGEPRCSLCATAGRPASHRLGGGACTAPQKKGRKAAAKAKSQKPPSSTATKRAEESQMDAG